MGMRFTLENFTMEKPMSNRKVTQYPPIYMKKHMLRDALKVFDADLQRLGVVPTEEGVNLLELIPKMMDKIKEVNRLTGRSENVDIAKLAIDEKFENVTTKRIKNQTLLSKLMPKEEAQSRVMELLTNYREMLILFNKEVSIRLEGDTRENEIYFTSKLNEIVDTVVKDKGKILEWEVDGSTRLLETRINRSIDEDETEMSNRLKAYVDETEKLERNAEKTGNYLIDDPDSELEL